MASPRIITQPSMTFTRPTDTTAYGSGDLMANSTTAGAVTTMNTTLPRLDRARLIRIPHILVQKSTTGMTSPSFRVHVGTIAPTYQTNGDNSAMSGNLLTGGTGVRMFFDVTMASVGVNGAWGIAVPPTGVIEHPAIVSEAGVNTLYFIMEARAAYAPGNAEIFTIRPLILLE